MRFIARVAGISLNTVAKLLIDAGHACVAYHDTNVRNVPAKRVQCDEIWSFCYAKAKNIVDANVPIDGADDVWTWTAIDADSKLIVSYFTGSRDAECAMILIDDLRYRLQDRVQLTMDGHNAYLQAVEGASGGEIDYAMLLKLYGSTSDAAKRRYGPDERIGARKERIEGNPDRKYVNTSFAERQNLTMRMSMRRVIRLTNVFSKKGENHAHALALYFMFYNFVRQHTTLRTSPAMATGLTSRLWDMSDIVKLIDDAEGEQKKRGSYEKRASIAN